jgi:type I restriction-modification system DNA methylase subunit
MTTMMTTNFEFLPHIVAESDPSELSEVIAKALDWTDIQRQSMGSQGDVATRVYLGPEPAAVIFGVVEPEPATFLPKAALYAYHSFIEWGLIANNSQAIVFNSHWVLNENWYSLPPLSWRDLNGERKILESITPRGLADNQIEKVALDYNKPDRFLVPVDDALVESLDRWRDEALRYARESLEVDEKLQTLFAQLFVLRAVEDRRLAPGMKTLREVLRPPKQIDLEQLRTLFQEAKSRIQSELFDFNTLDAIPELVLAGIISDLYTPRHLPGKIASYNFSWIDASVLGRAYEKYLSSLLVPAAMTPQLFLWQQPEREVDRISVQKSRGVYYTPPFLVQYLTDACLKRFCPDDIEADEVTIPRVLDPSCGSGSFLSAATDYLLRRLRDIDPDRNWASELVENKKIIGVDIDKRAVTLARLSLWLRFAEEPAPLPLPRLTDAIVCGDALAPETWTSLPEEYDVVLGNPPFLATGKVQKRERLGELYKTASGRFDYSYLFIELAIGKLREHGILGMVVPNRLFRNRDASVLREILSLGSNILTLTEFITPEVFEGATAYVGTLVAELTSSGDDGTARIVRVLRLPSRFRAALLTRAAESSQAISESYYEAYDAPIPPGSLPWVLMSPRDRRARVLLEETSVSLSELAGIYQGIKTGANDIFIVHLVSRGQGPLWQIQNGLGDVAIIEAEVLRPVVFGIDIQRYDRLPSRGSDTPERLLIYPYRDNASIPETRLKEELPHTYEYLRRYQSLLVDRASGLRWFELVRRRDEAWLSGKKLLSKDLALRTSFAIDALGEVYLVGGTAVVPADPDHLLPLLAFLNSAVANWFISQSTSTFRTGFQKIEPQHLQDLPVPRRIVEYGDLQDTMASLASQAIHARLAGNSDLQDEIELEIDRIVAALAGLKPEDIKGARL